MLCLGKGSEGAVKLKVQMSPSQAVLSVPQLLWQQGTQLQFLSVNEPREDFTAAVFSPLKHRHLQKMYSSPLVA